MKSYWEGSPLREPIFRAIDENLLVTIAITSLTQGKIPADGLPFGMGKSTLALWLSFLTYRDLLRREGEDVETSEGVARAWGIVFQNLFLDPRKLDAYIFRHPNAPKPPVVNFENRIPFVVWDDMQETVGKHNRFDRYLYSLATRLTKGREWVANLVGTMPMINQLFKPYRECWVLEILIPRRACFEVQKIHYTRNFARWLDTKTHAWYLGETWFFSPLPPSVETAYQEWKEQEHRLVDERRWKDLERDEEMKEAKFRKLVDREKVKSETIELLEDGFMPEKEKKRAPTLEELRALLDKKVPPLSPPPLKTRKRDRLNDVGEDEVSSSLKVLEELVEGEP